MANYLQLKQQFNSNKKHIQMVLNDQKCQFRLKSDGLSTLNNFIDETTKRITIIPKVDNPTYSYTHL